MRVLALVLIVFLVGCVTIQSEVESGSKVITEGQERTYTNNVRLMEEGFDINEVYMRPGDSIDIFVADNGVDGHYILLNNERVTDREIGKGETINIGFPDEGEYTITDETSKSFLNVIVE